MVESLIRAAVESPAITWKPWATPSGRSPQYEFLKAAETHRTRVFRSGNRIGKTACGAKDIVCQCLGIHPFAAFKTPVNWWASGLDWEFGVGQVLWPAIKSLIINSDGEVDERLVKHISYMRRSPPELPMFIMFNTGSTITFKSSDSGARKYQGVELHGVWLDEEHPSDVVEECRARLIKVRGYLTVTLTPIQRLRWVQELEREPGTAVFRASMIEAAEAGLLDKDAVEQFANALPERQRRVRVYGDNVSLEGQVYPEFQRTTHIARPRGGQLVIGGDPVAPWPIPESWPRYAAIDWGFSNPTAVTIAAEDPVNKRLVFYRCYYSTGIRASEWARLLKDERLPKLRFPIVADHDSDARQELMVAGISNVAAKKDVDTGIESVARLLAKKCPDGHPGMIMVDTGENDKILGRCDAEKIAWEMELYHYPPDGKDGKPDPRDIPVKKDDHAMDAIRYLVVAWQRRNGESAMAMPEKPASGARSALSSISPAGRLFGR